jgi:small-conductance mechanosensitive channel
MPNDVTEIENELRSVTQVKRQVEEQIVALQQRLHDDEIWLELNTPATAENQETWEEVRALPAYTAELYAQAMSLADVLLDLTLERERWDNPDLLLAS